MDSNTKNALLLAAGALAPFLAAGAQGAVVRGSGRASVNNGVGMTPREKDDFHGAAAAMPAGPRR